MNTYLLLEHIEAYPVMVVRYSFLKYTDNETTLDDYHELVQFINEELGRRGSLCLYPRPMKQTTVEDFGEDMPTRILEGPFKKREVLESYKTSELCKIFTQEGLFQKLCDCDAQAQL
jgi:hypothetical protein